MNSLQKNTLTRIERKAKEEKRKKLILENKYTDEELDQKVNEWYSDLLKQQGPDKVYRCVEEYNGINISSKLDLIRKDNNEHTILLAIKDSKIVDYRILNGNEDMVPETELYEEGFPFMKHWYDQGATILNYHNHPARFAARPSQIDVLSLTINDTLDTNISNEKQKKFNKFKSIEHDDNICLGFCYGDWGVVTEIDFFSKTQKPSVIKECLSEPSV